MAHEQCDLLYTHLLTRAKALLEKNGELYPIAAMLETSSEIRPVMAYWGDEHPDSQKVIDELSLALTSQAFPQRSAALGLAYDIRFSDGKDQSKSDAIKVDIEHANGESITVITPYSKRENGTIDLSDPFSMSKPAQWFVSHQNGPH
jgi:hypothetical protein